MRRGKSSRTFSVRPLNSRPAVVFQVYETYRWVARPQKGRKAEEGEAYDEDVTEPPGADW